MDPWIFGILDGALVALVALGLGLWQYVSVTREIARDKAKAIGEAPDTEDFSVGSSARD